jgi:hypothetical protein
MWYFFLIAVFLTLYALAFCAGMLSEMLRSLSSALERYVVRKQDESGLMSIWGR